jgi:hypothetical protein
MTAFLYDDAAPGEDPIDDEDRWREMCGEDDPEEPDAGTPDAG